ncbi:MAG TPA: molybdopterin oxidoreductase family protein [Rhodopila sp.]|uniref:molybdopterin-containing oxidoreductase family protein n=1 Tax=Rhodopila sp. TaxID=2480087 RepID=UPI002CA608C0|nr:molybdopterin oxidoreductase family protein [Rhodopila sp.]HVY16335.1 molybdopterin oxidoreductase family protein [Rhodopila sp.]
MSIATKTEAAEWVKSACPHDCPSACALEVERLSQNRIGTIRGAADNTYTAGVICAKVARYRERVHHPDRLRTPQRRVGEKGTGAFQPLSWDDALDEIAEAFTRATQRHGSEAVWPYHSGGTMGLLQRYGIDRLRNAMRYSRQQTTICVTPAQSGWMAGIGKMNGTDPREMADSDLIVVWGGNPVSTQVNAMVHITRARKRGAKLVVIDVYETPTAKTADLALILRPGTDAALACAVMHVLLKEDLADRDYLARYTDFGPDVEAHLAGRGPEWAAGITGLSVEEITGFARLYGATKRSFLRPGFGFTRSRNGSAAMHAVSCLPAITGAWREPGGGAFFLNIDWGLDTTLAHGLDMLDPTIRVLDQSRIGPVLCGEAADLKGGPPVTAMFMQNANSANVAGDSRTVRRGLSREDLFLCVHEQFPTATTRYADILLPAAQFLEYDDLYYGLGHTHLNVGLAVLDRYEDARTNHEVIGGIARRLGCNQPCFSMSAREILDLTLHQSGRGTLEEAAERGWIDCAPAFEDAHFLNGFAHSDGLFHFKPQWSHIGPEHAIMPPMPDHVALIEAATDDHPFRMVAPPARSFLNTSFTETPSSRAREGEPRALLHPEDAAMLGLDEGDGVCVGNRRGQITLAARPFPGVQRGVVIVEGIWPNTSFAGALGVNQLIGADRVPPNGGTAFHDTAVWLRPAER